MNQPANLTINHDAKPIPYGSGAMREDGTQNLGFMNLKADPDMMAKVPELKKDPTLLNLVASINAPETGLLTIGCDSGDVSEAEGHRKTGYVELSFATAEMVEDAQSYFPLFYHFSHSLHEEAFDEHMFFGWEIQPAIFIKAATSGFTVAIFLNTGFCKRREEAEDIWSVSLEFLARYLGQVPSMAGRSLF